MARFFISDNHFTDDRFNLFYRPFKTVEEQDQFMIDKWNSVVGPKDEVYHLGDFSTTDKGLNLVKKLNGTIHLITGNYDDPRPDSMLNSLFESVQENMTIKLSNGQEVFMNHYPVKANPKSFNLVGHIHGLWKVQRNMINVSCDAWHFTPVSEDEIVFAMNAIDKFYDEHVFAGELPQNINFSHDQVIYAEESIPEDGRAIFLAGPTPRELSVDSWRPEMIDAIKAKGINDYILVPEKRNPEEGYDYDKQIAWEHKALERADKIIFWVPRELNKMPGFTTNVEFGYWVRSGKCILGYPKDAEKMRYLHSMAEQHNTPIFNSMESVVMFMVIESKLSDTLEKGLK